MVRLHVHGLELETYVKLCAAIGAAAGFVWGLVRLLGALLGFPVASFFGTEGWAAGLLEVGLMPAAFAFGGMLAGVMTHLPFNWLMHAVGGMWLEAEDASPEGLDRKWVRKT